MRKIALIIMVLFLFSVISVAALSADDARQVWVDAKEKRMELDSIHKQAKLDYVNDPSDENKQKVVGTAKDLLSAVLDEAEAWLDWKKIDAEENVDVPQDLKDKIINDVDKNRNAIDELRGDVSKIENPAGAGLVTLKMFGKYGELLTDVARNSGYVWVHIANEKADKIDEYESKLRAATDNEELLAKLDVAKAELATARSKIDIAENAYDNVKLPGQPIIKFAEGNSYLRQAKTNLINAYVQLNYVYTQITRET